MFYGDIQFIDILLFAGIAAFLLYRLNNILGRRTGFDKKSTTSPIENSEISKNKARAEPDKVSIPELEENIKELETAYKTINNFDHAMFLEGAKAAFETILKLFNNGDKEGLKKLLTKDVYKGFCDAIDSNQTKIQKEILSLEIESVKKVWIEGKKIFITIVFLSNQIDPSGENKVTKKDNWTFEKVISSNDPKWLLSLT